MGNVLEPCLTIACSASEAAQAASGRPCKPPNWESGLGSRCPWAFVYLHQYDEFPKAGSCAIDYFDE